MKAGIYGLMSGHIFRLYSCKRQAQIHVRLLDHSLSLHLDDLIDLKNCSVFSGHDVDDAVDCTTPYADNNSSHSPGKLLGIDDSNFVCISIVGP